MKLHGEHYLREVCNCKDTYQRAKMYDCTLIQSLWMARNAVFSDCWFSNNCKVNQTVSQMHREKPSPKRHLASHDLTNKRHILGTSAE